MKLVALNEHVAAYVPSQELSEMGVDALLNRLMTVRSWKGLIGFLKGPGVGNRLARREIDPLSGIGLPGGDNYWYEPLWGHLNTWVDKDLEIDFLDELTRSDLLGSEEPHEVWVPELLSYAEDFRCLLTLAAVALGKTRAPEDMFEAVDPGEYLEDEEVRDWFFGRVAEPFRRGAEIGFLRFNTKYWPASEYGPYELCENNCCFACDLGDRKKDYCSAADEELGVLGFRFYYGGDEDPMFVSYDKEGMDEEIVERLACGLIVAPVLGVCRWDDESCFKHLYADLPDEIDGGTFSLENGFGLVSESFSFTRWQDDLVQAVEEAVLSGRVALCPYCGTPIITRGEKDRVEYCCSSHKTSASKQRRERAIALCLRGVPLEEAVMDIGQRYSDSVVRWYDEARALGHID
ncbi:MAG: hypothetical protein Q4B45_01100 [Coriobacteriia bacterium]|nr:hypothetical protein [Coriobacteriia bacterium]